jgi:hypothetical protein
MGFMDKFKRSVGIGPKLDPEIERAVETGLRDFVRDDFVKSYIRSRKDGDPSDGFARGVLMSKLDMDLSPGIMDKAIDLAAACARCHLPGDLPKDQEPALNEALRAAVARRFRRNVLLKLIEEEISAAEAQSPARKS